MIAVTNLGFRKTNRYGSENVQFDSYSFYKFNFGMFCHIILEGSATIVL